MLILACCLVALALVALGARLLAGYPRPEARFMLLGRSEIALIGAAAETLYPAGGAVLPSGREADLEGYVDRYLLALPKRIRLLMRLLFLLVEHATLLFPAPGRGGWRRFSALPPEQREAVLEGWRRSRLFPRRLVFTTLRAILTMGYFAHPAVLRALRLAPLAIETPVTEADLLYPRVGETPEAIAWTRADLTPPRPPTPLDPDGPLHPDFAGEAT
jgi:hypothetical protein